MAMMLFMATANTTLQLNSDPAMRGRVMALYGLLFLGLATRKYVFDLHFQYSSVLFPVLWAAVPDGIGLPDAIVDESDEDEAELGVFQDAVGDHAAELAGADDQDALEADAAAPPPLEEIADDLAGQIGGEHAEADEKRPHRP